MQYVTVTLMACQAGCCQEREWPPRQGVPDLGAGLPGGTGASTLRLRVQYPPLVFVGVDPSSGKVDEAQHEPSGGRSAVDHAVDRCIV
jgi:hypothetical protein